MSFDLGPFIQKYQTKDYKTWRKEHPEDCQDNSSDGELMEVPPQHPARSPAPPKEPEKRSLGRLTNNSMSTDHVVNITAKVSCWSFFMDQISV